MLPRPVTWLLVLLAALLLPVALLSAWVSTQVSDTDEYVETVAPLAEEQALRDAAHDEIRAQVLAGLDPRLRAQPEVRPALDRALTQVLESPEFPTAWEDANRILHRQVLRILDGEAAAGTRDGWVQVDLAPLVDDLTRALRREGVRVPDGLADRDLTVDALRTSDVEQARGKYELLEAAGLWLPVAWLLLVALAVLTARRRIATLGHVAVTSLVTLGLLALALTLVGREVFGAGEETVPAVLWKTLTSGLWTTLWSALGIAALALAARIVLGVVRSATDRRS